MGSALVVGFVDFGHCFNIAKENKDLANDDHSQECHAVLLRRNVASLGSWPFTVCTGTGTLHRQYPRRIKKEMYSWNYD